MNQFLNLLLNFQSLPRIRREKSFMEVSGYPHYENVCTNILGFYFDPDEEHGMGNLFLTAFFKMVNERAIKATGTEDFADLSIEGPVRISREHPANDQKRIDLVVDADAFTIGIENKIFHWEANDFENYGSVIDSLGANKLVIKAVLCLRTRQNDPLPKGGFLRYTYSELWNQVRNLLGHHLVSASPKWTTYLTEFMTTTDRLAGETPEEKEVTDFFMKNHELIEQLVSDHQQLRNRLAARLRNILEQVKDVPEFAKYRRVRGLDGSNVLATHFDIKGCTIALDLVVELTGWKLQFWGDGPNHIEILMQLTNSGPMHDRFPGITIHGNFAVLEQWDLHIGELELLQAVTTGYTAVISGADSL